MTMVNTVVNVLRDILCKRMDLASISTNVKENHPVKIMLFAKILLVILNVHALQGWLSSFLTHFYENNAKQILIYESTIEGFEGNDELKEDLHCRDIDECAHQNLYAT